MSNKATMDAIVLHGVSDLRYEQVPLPKLRPNTVRVQVAYCGVCGSDIPRCFSKGTYRFPTICGHEFAGTIAECAADVLDYQVGDRVAVFPLLWRDDHPACEVGKYAQSDGYDYLGSRSDGGFADYVIAPVRNLLRVPRNVTLEEAAMTEPAAVALHAVRRAHVQLGDTVAIFGLGPIGLMVAQWVRAMGAGEIALFDIQTEKLELARSLGFQQVFDSRKVDATGAVEKLTGGRGVHVAIEAAGVSATMIAAMKATRRSGRVVLLGNPAGDVTLPAEVISQVMRREIDLKGTWNSDFSVYGDDDDWRTTLAAMASGTLNLKPLITHRVPLRSGIEMLQVMRDQSTFFAKVLVHPNSSQD